MRSIMVTFIGLAGLVSATLQAGPATRPATGPSSLEYIRQLIEQLADPDYARREQATKALQRIGPAAIELVEQAAASSQPERAIRALGILRQLRGRFFQTVQVQLQVSAGSIRWDQPICLVASFRNVGQASATLPFGGVDRQVARLSARQQQISNMLDVADFLHVVGPDGQPVELRVDSLGDLQPLLKLLKQPDGAFVSTLPPGQTLVRRLEQFNRGWARYPLLQAGQYRIWFEYVPPTRPDAQVRPRRLRSNMVTVEVVDPAPPPIGQPGSPLQAELVRHGRLLLFSLVNCCDLPIYVNADFGPDPRRQARFGWIVEPQERLSQQPRATIAIAPRPGRIVQLAPGQRWLICRARLPDLQDYRDIIRLQPPQRYRIRAYYSNALNRRLAVTALADQPDLARRLPPGIFTGRVVSNTVRLTSPATDQTRQPP